MKATVHGLFLAILLVVQTTWLEAIAVFGVKPNLFIVYIVTLSCFCSKKEGAIVGFFFGIMLDFAACKMIGLNAVLLLLLGFLTADFCEQVIRKNSVWIVMLITLVTSVCYELIYYVISFVGDLEFKAVFFRTLLPECIYNCLVTVPFYFVIKKLSSTLWTDKGESIG